jgi:hypothetical protein
MPSVVSIDAGAVVRTVNDHVLGADLPGWDGYLANKHYSRTDTTPDPGTVTMIQNAGLRMLRLSSGSGTDEWHFDKEFDPNGFTSGAGLLARLTGQVGAEGMVTVNYGTGTPQEAAAYLAYLNATADSPVVIGVDSKGKDWGTAGSWAALRGQGPLAVDDGLNHLRASHPDPYGFKYFEVANEAYYGAWQGYKMPSPVAYVTFTHAFADLAQQIDPTTSIGVGVGNPGEWDKAWNVPVLKTCAAQGFTPGFLSDHFYAYDGNSEAALSDGDLLLHTVSDPASVMPIHANAPRNWAGRAQAYRALLRGQLGDAGAGVELMCAEFNSDADASNKQSTNLVHGLWLADAIGSLLQTEYNGAAFWDLRNNYADRPDDPTFSGWRTGADDGMIGSPSDTAGAPATGPYVAYPAYFAEQLASLMVHTGDTVVSAQSDTATLSAYAVLQQNGHLDLLVINKSATQDDAVTFNVAGFDTYRPASLWTYGQAEDTAQGLTADGSASLTQSGPLIGLDIVGGPSFGWTFPAYSMSVLDLVPNVRPEFGGGIPGPVPLAAIPHEGAAPADAPRAPAIDPAPWIGLALTPRTEAPVMSTTATARGNGGGQQGGRSGPTASPTEPTTAAPATTFAPGRPSSYRADEWWAGLNGDPLADVLSGPG